jgi:hypothetical protein
MRGIVSLYGPLQSSCRHETHILKALIREVADSKLAVRVYVRSRRLKTVGIRSEREEMVVDFELWYSPGVSIYSRWRDTGFQPVWI